LFEHRLDGDRALTSAGRREVARWVLFLYSEVEYTWPTSYSFMQIHNALMSLLTFGWWERRKERAFAAFARLGDFDVWPFRTRADYQIAIRRPRFFAGHST
jgi:hypothetical protein